MSDFDLEKISNAATNVVTSYVTSFFGVLLHPRQTILQELSSDGSAPLQGAIRYAAISILLGISIATFLKLPGVEGIAIPQAAFAILFFWLAVGGFVHMLIRLIRAQGTIAQTTTAFLYAVGTTHPLWVLLAALTAPLITDTKVTLTYEYVIFMGDSAIKSETFVREKEPDKDKTIIPPITERLGNSYAGEVARVPLSESKWPKPKREERFYLNGLGKYLAGGYALIAAIYLAIALAAAHSLATWKMVLLMLLLSPMPIGVVFIGLFFL